MAVQHLRTKAMRERMLNGMDNRLAGRAEQTWPIMRTAFATNIGWSLYSERERWRIRVLSAAEQLRFITGDQPILNLRAQTGDHDDLALYYPVSPTRAALLELCDASSSIGPTDELNDATVGELNRKMAGGIHEQAFGSDLAYLNQLLNA